MFRQTTEPHPSTWQSSKATFDSTAAYTFVNAIGADRTDRSKVSLCVFEAALGAPRKSPDLRALASGRDGAAEALRETLKRKTHPARLKLQHRRIEDPGADEELGHRRVARHVGLLLLDLGGGQQALAREQRVERDQPELELLLPCI